MQKVTQEASGGPFSASFWNGASHLGFLPPFPPTACLDGPVWLTMLLGRHINVPCTYQTLLDLIPRIDQCIDCLNANIAIHDNVRVITVTPKERKKQAFTP